MPLKEIILPSSITVVFLYMIIRINIYPVLISGWASNSKYALIGALRAVAQTVSYEVCLALILIFYLCLTGRIRIIIIMLSNRIWNKVIILLPIVGIWLISCLAETNRTPFDFAEGESELVSGFNIEYGRLGFALIFMAEYARIFLIGLIFSFMFITSSCLNLWTYFFFYSISKSVSLSAHNISTVSIWQAYSISMKSLFTFNTILFFLQNF